MRSGLRLCPLLFLLVPLLATAAPSRFQVGQVAVGDLRAVRFFRSRMMEFHSRSVANS